MKRVDLCGKWSFHEVGRGKWFEATVPGTNFADLIRNDVIPHPYYDANESLVQWVGERDWEYVRTFNLSHDMLKMPVLILECCGLDTLAEIYVNDKLVGKTDNAYITYTYDIKAYVSRLTNKIRIKFRSPINYIEKMLEQAPLFSNRTGMTGASYLRKPSNHFGWSNSPCLPLSGIIDRISIIGYEELRISNVNIGYELDDGVAHIRTDISLKGSIAEEEERTYYLLVTITEPSGEKHIERISKLSESNSLTVDIIKPKLWTTYDMLEEGEKPATYGVTVGLFRDKDLIDGYFRRLGLRNVDVDRKKDNYGRRFELILNGEKVLIKGAVINDNDIINPMFSREKAMFWLRAAMDANINMVRVFAGYGYQNEEFYNLCDELGVLVWQDMPFSDYDYPFGNKDFRTNVAREVASQLRRLHTHPSLVIMSGGYVIEHRCKLWLLSRDKVKEIHDFLYDFLPEEISKVTDKVYYLPSAPLSSKFGDRANGDRAGVSRLWAVWDGMRSLRSVTKRTPRFCLEFGMPSLPGVRTIDRFSESGKYNNNPALMDAHMKSRGGVGRMLYYVSTRFRVPRNIDDMVYYSQLTQAEYYKEMVEHLRRHGDKCSGYIFASLNECWPGIDNSAIDYLGNYKAVMYKARQFNSDIIISALHNRDTVELHVTSDIYDEIKGTVHWYIEKFDGEKIAVDIVDCMVRARGNTHIETLNLREYIKENRRDRLFVAELYDENGEFIARDISLFVPNKLASLPNPELSYSLEINKGVAYVTVRAEKFVRYVKVRIEGINEPFNDNYFDLLAGEETVVSVPVGKATVDEILPRLSVKSVANVDQKGTLMRDFSNNVNVFTTVMSMRDAIKYTINK